ncbi:inhibitor of nuclear factor kappa-B kinase-interacting protein [Coturnix japonica]|uniref:inhibitor of nuclear factor kappa-B kinase-interacting protein n=1 Tax=Coturnix japonica TaxID=93934 RepID=UPI000777828D|nr:inhibitor of nuclear factor kappa-B kinase-interacting protein [Coturnix japonica]
MSEVKQRKKGFPSPESNEGSQKLEKHSSHGKVHGPRVSHSQSSIGMDSRMALGVISLSACLVMAWLLFQQSSRFADLEKRYNFLQQEAERFLDMENKVSLISEKLESADSILQESASSISVMTEFEQEVSSLHNTVREIENNEETLFTKMQGIKEKIQNITDSWRRSVDEMNANTSGIKSEAKFIHTEVTSQINKVDQRIKSLSERLKDLEDGTARNIKTVKRQEGDEFDRLEQKLDSHATAIGKLEEEQNSLLAKNTDLNQKLADYEPKIEECKTHLPKIESAIHSILRLSSELLSMEKKVEDLAAQLYTMESNMLKAASDTAAMHNILEGTRYNDSMSKLQNKTAGIEGVARDMQVSLSAEGITSEGCKLESDQGGDK